MRNLRNKTGVWVDFWHEWPKATLWNHFQTSTKKGGAGGISIFIKKYLNFIEINNFDHFGTEHVYVKLFVGANKFVVYGLYNPPQKLLQLKLFNELQMLHANCILMGDLNSRTTSIGCMVTNKTVKSWKTSSKPAF